MGRWAVTQRQLSSAKFIPVSLLSPTGLMGDLRFQVWHVPCTGLSYPQLPVKSLKIICHRKVNPGFKEDITFHLLHSAYTSHILQLHLQQGACSRWNVIYSLKPAFYMDPLYWGKNPITFYSVVVNLTKFLQLNKSTNRRGNKLSKRPIGHNQSKESIVVKLDKWEDWDCSTDPHVRVCCA